MSARQRFLEQHDEAHEVSGIGSDGLRVTLRRFDNYDIAWAYSRRSKEKYTDLRVDTYGRRGRDFKLRHYHDAIGSCSSANPTPA